MINWRPGEPQWEPDPDRAVWKSVADYLRSRILDGTYGERNAIPTLAVLVDELGVARNTIRKAVDHLAKEGYLSPEQGVGTFVTPRSKWPA